MQLPLFLSRVLFWLLLLGKGKERRRSLPPSPRKVFPAASSFLLPTPLPQDTHRQPFFSLKDEIGGFLLHNFLRKKNPAFPFPLSSFLYICAAVAGYSLLFALVLLVAAPLFFLGGVCVCVGFGASCLRRRWKCRFGAPKTPIPRLIATLLSLFRVGGREEGEVAEEQPPFSHFFPPINILFLLLLFPPLLRR